MISTLTNFNLIKWSRVDQKHAVAIAWRQTTTKKIRVKVVAHANVWFIITATQQFGKEGNL